MSGCGNHESDIHIGGVMKNLIMAILLTANVASAQVYSAFEFAQYKATNRTDSTLRSMVTAIGTNNNCMMVLDGGKWDIATNVTFSANIGIMFVAGSYLNITNPLAIVTLGTGAPFEAPPMLISQGSGILTGAPNFDILYTEWGTNVNIGNGAVRGWVVAQNYITFATVTNAYEENGGTIVTTTSRDRVPLSYITGLYGDWSTTNSVVFSTGEGYLSNSNLFQSSGSITSIVTSLTTALDWHYAYLTNTVSGSITSGDVVWSTNEPSETVNGWYLNNNRCIGSFISTNGAAALVRFENYGSEYIFSTSYSLASSMNPDASWQTPDDNEGDTYTPVNVDKARISISAGDAATYCIGLLATKEFVDLGAYLPGAYGGNAWVFILENYWVSLGPSRKVRVRGEDDDDNALSSALTGYTIKR